MSPENKKALVWAEIDLARLRDNLHAIRRHIGEARVGVLAIVKANAYGHGMVPVAQELYGEGVRFFGVATLEEALELRKHIRSARVLVLGSFHREQVPLYLRARVTPTISCLEDLVYFDRAVKRAGFAVHVKIDTGMGRLGVWHEEAGEFFRKAGALRNVRIEGIYTHFASADRKDPKRTHRQILHFERSVQTAERYGIKPKYLHAANSMGLLRFRRAHLNLVRPGLVLYGLNPTMDRLAVRIRPVLSLKTRISFLKKAGKGRAISYGSTFRTSRPTWIATLPVGYSHGYRVDFSNRSSVLVKGRLCPVVGRVTMDQTLADVGPSGSAKRWDEVTLIGEGAGARITAEDLARLAETIPYEIVCSIHSRVPRIYRGARHARGSFLN